MILDAEVFDGADGYEVVSRAAARGLRPRRPLWPSEWAAKNRTLSTKSSAEATKWRNERIPYLVAIMDALDVRHPAWMVVFAKASQVGATECGLNWVGHTIDEDPGPMAAMFPGEKLGRRWMRKRCDPMITSTPSLRAKIPAGRRSDGGSTLAEKDFPDGGLSVLSANIAVDMASDAYAKLMLDEVDRFPFEIGDEGDPVEIVLRRMATFVGRRKAFLNSSPTIESLSHINPWWLESSQAHYFVPCPHCNAMQALVWSNVTYLEGKPKDARYMCAECAVLIEHHQKTEMLAAGQWRHTFPERESEIVGFHINCLYTPIGLGDTWGDNAVVWERAKRSPSKAKSFVNTRLGETHKDPNEKLEWDEVYNRREPFKLREITRGVLLLTAGVDVQKDRLEVMVAGWTRPGRYRTVDYQIIDGDPTRPEIWDELDDYLAREYVNECGVKMRVTLTLVDSGYVQEHVLTFTRSRKGRGIFAAKGSRQHERAPIGRPTMVDVVGKAKARENKVGARQYQIGVSKIKEALYDKLRTDAGSSESPVLPDERHFRFSDELPEEFFRQLCAEVYDPNKRRWIKIYERNEVLDTIVLCIAAGMHHAVAIDRMVDADWDRLEEMYEPAGKHRAGAEPVAPVAAPPVKKVSEDPRFGSDDSSFGSPDWEL